MAPKRDPERPLLRSGELARRAGVSVRALHHYEEIGLLVPRRSAAGQRLYGAAEVARLARISALAALGLSLAEVRRCLDARDWSPLRLVEVHLERARAALGAQQALCARLERLREQLLADPQGPQGEPGALAHFIETAEVMSMIERYYPEEQLQALGRRREALGEAAIREVEQAWAGLAAEVQAELERGTPPGAPAAQALARRWSELSERTAQSFSGGDPGLRASLDRLHTEQPPERIHPGFDPAVFAYMREACARLGAARER